MSSPIKVYKYGNVSVSVFENEAQGKEGKFTTLSYQVQKCYRVGDETKFTNSLKANEIPLAILCLEEAYKDNYTKEEEL